MTESGYYPPGAEFDPKAPWNEERIPEKSFNICVSQSLSKSTQVVTDDYNPEFDDEDGCIYADTSDTDWESVYNHNGLHTPLELIKLFKEFLEKHLPDPIIDLRGFKEAKSLISECKNWVEDELEIIEE